MTVLVPRSSDTVLPIAGAIVATSGLAATAALLDAAGRLALLPLSEVGIALAVGILVFDRSGIVGTSRSARSMLLLFGVGPLLYGLEAAATPRSVIVGTLTIGVITVATVVTAVLVARTGRLHGVARWTLLLVAADALLTAVMSTVPAEGLVLAYLGGHLELVRPLTLLAWGIALILQSTAIRRHIAAAIANWKQTTDIGGSDQAAPPTTALSSKPSSVSAD